MSMPVSSFLFAVVAYNYFLFNTILLVRCWPIRARLFHPRRVFFYPMWIIGGVLIAVAGVVSGYQYRSFVSMAAMSVEVLATALNVAIALRMPTENIMAIGISVRGWPNFSFKPGHWENYYQWALLGTAVLLAWYPLAATGKLSRWEFVIIVVVVSILAIAVGARRSHRR